MSANDKPSTIHCGIEITYEERTDDWHFTLRDRERTAKTLAAAKEAIAKPAPKQAKPFKRFDAWYMEYGEGVKSVEVTSIAEPGYRGTDRLRIKSGNKTKTVEASAVFPKNTKNDAIIAEIKVADGRIADLRKQREKLVATLTPAKVEPEPA